MADTKSTDIHITLGKRYSFPQLSTPDVEVLETRESWVEFYEGEFVWLADFRGIWKDDEDPATKIVADREKDSFWRYTIVRTDIRSIEYSWDMGISLWVTNIYLATSDKVIRLAFNTKDKAHRMYTYFCQYRGFEHY